LSLQVGTEFTPLNDVSWVALCPSVSITQISDVMSRLSARTLVSQVLR
jgi:hypothetical protein